MTLSMRLTLVFFLNNKPDPPFNQLQTRPTHRCQNSDVKLKKVLIFPPGDQSLFIHRWDKILFKTNMHLINSLK